MYQKYTQINVLLIVLLLPSIGTSAYAQTYHFTSQEGGFGLWTDENTWTKNFNWVNDTPSTTGGSNSNSEIYGYVLRDGNLTLASGNNSIVYGTLRIEGNLILSGGAQITVESDGILWISGNLTMNGGADIYVKPGGLLVVGGDMNASNGAGGKIDGVAVVRGDLRVTNDVARNFEGSSGDYYVYEDTYYDGNDISAYGIPNEDAFKNDHPDLYAFVEGGGPQPITLLSFEGYATTEGVVLEWITETEENFDFFTVERAGSDLQFEAVGQVKGHGFSTQELNYDFVDHNPLVGVTYYRLKATDYDGSEEYHKVVAVMVEKKTEPQSSVFPNPVVDKRVQVQTSHLNSQLQLISYNGTTVFRSGLQVGRNSYELPEYLPAGYYTAVIINSQGQREQHRVLIR